MAEQSYNATPGLALSDEQIAAAAYEAGFKDPTSLATITAIAGKGGGQSGGSPGAIGVGVPPSDYEYSLGLTQINVSPSGGSPELASKYGALNLLTPITNLRAAHDLGGGTSWTPWETGADYQAGLSSAQVGASYRAADPNAMVEAETVLNLPPSQIVQIANSAQTSAQNALQGATLPNPPQPAQQLPPSAAGLTSGTVGPSGPAGPKNASSSTSSSGTVTLSGVATNTPNPIFNLLAQISNLMNPTPPQGSGGTGLLGEIGSAISDAVEVGFGPVLGAVSKSANPVTDVTSAGRLVLAGLVRLGLAIPGFVGLVVGLLFVGAGGLIDIIPGGKIAAKAAPEIAASSA